MCQTVVWAQVHLQSILKGQVLFICVPLFLRLIELQ